MGITHSADMNDICTTLDPNFEPKFQVAPVGPYTDDMKNRLRTYYPNITPFYFQDTPKDTYDAIKVVIGHEKGWKIKHESEYVVPDTKFLKIQDLSAPDRLISVLFFACRDELLLEFEATTALMKFTDDVVIQVKPWGPTGSVVNMRSRSRVGAGDWGANYKRMRYINSRAALHHAKAPAGMEVKNYVADNAPAIDETPAKATKKKSKAKLDKKTSSVSSKSSEDAIKEKKEAEAENTLTGSQSSAHTDGIAPTEKKKKKSKSQSPRDQSAPASPRDADSPADPAPSSPPFDTSNLTED